MNRKGKERKGGEGRGEERRGLMPRLCLSAAQIEPFFGCCFFFSKAGERSEIRHQVPGDNPDACTLPIKASVLCPGWQLCISHARRMHSSVMLSCAALPSLSAPLRSFQTSLAAPASQRQRQCSRRELETWSPLIGVHLCTQQCVQKSPLPKQ